MKVKGKISLRLGTVERANLAPLWVNSGEEASLCGFGMINHNGVLPPRLQKLTDRVIDKVQLGTVVYNDVFTAKGALHTGPMRVNLILLLQ